MKIAYCFGGHLRTFRSNDTLGPMLLERYPGDIFIHTFSRLNVPTSWHNDVTGYSTRVDQSDIDFILDRYSGVKRIEVDRLRGGADAAPPNCRNLGARCALEGAQLVRERYEKETGSSYDVVFMLRFDLVLREPFVMPETIDPMTLYGGRNLNMEEKGLDGDVFSFGHPSVLRAIYVPAFPDKYLEQIPSFGYQGESLNTAMRIDGGFSYQSVPVKHSLLRSTGLMHVRG